MGTFIGILGWAFFVVFLILAKYWKEKSKKLEDENTALKDEKSKLSDKVREKGTLLTSAENKINRLQREVDEH